MAGYSEYSTGPVRRVVHGCVFRSLSLQLLPLGSIAARVFPLRANRTKSDGLSQGGHSIRLLTDGDFQPVLTAWVLAGTRGYSWVLRYSPGHNDFQGALELADHLLRTKQTSKPDGMRRHRCQAESVGQGRASRCEFAARKAAISSAESAGSVVTAASERG